MFMTLLQKPQKLINMSSVFELCVTRKQEFVLSYCKMLWNVAVVVTRENEEKTEGSNHTDVIKLTYDVF